VVLRVAVVTPPPVLTGCGEPTLAPLSLNCTVPVGAVPAPEPGAVTLIVAVRVKDWPNTDVPTEDVTAVLVEA